MYLLNLNQFSLLSRKSTVSFFVMHTKQHQFTKLSLAPSSVSYSLWTTVIWNGCNMHVYFASFLIFLELNLLLKNVYLFVNCCLDLHNPSCSSYILHMYHKICSHWFGDDLERPISSVLFTVIWVGSIT